MTNLQYVKIQIDDVKHKTHKTKDDYTSLKDLCLEILREPKMIEPNERVHYEVYLAEAYYSLVVDFQEEGYRKVAVNLFEHLTQFGKTNNLEYPEYKKYLLDYSSYQRSLDGLRKEQ